MPSTLRADRRVGNLGICDGALPAMNLLPVNRFFVISMGINAH